MKPFKFKYKVSFGDFKSAMEAARAVDAAFYYYDKNKWRNFRDSPEFLPPLPGALTEEAKLKFVKKQARSLASCALSLPSTWEPGNRCDELKIRASRTPIEPGSATRADHAERGNGGIPATSIGHPNHKDRFEAIKEEDVDPLHSRVAERASLSIQPLEAISRSDTRDLVEDGHSQAKIHPLTKTLLASTAAILETVPEILDDDESWSSIKPESLMDEELSPLDVNDYDIEVPPILQAEPSPVQGSVYTLQ